MADVAARAPTCTPRRPGVFLDRRCPVSEPATGPTNSLVDVAGLRVGHAQRVGDGWLTGHHRRARSGRRGGRPASTYAAAARAPGRPTCSTRATWCERVHAVVLTGGSAYGLAAADGVMGRLEAAGVGFPVGGPGEVVPIVPAAVVFDLGRGGDFRRRPGRVVRRAGVRRRAGPTGAAARPAGLRRRRDRRRRRRAEGRRRLGEHRARRRDDGRGPGRGQRARVGGRPADRRAAAVPGTACPATCPAWLRAPDPAELRGGAGAARPRQPVRRWPRRSACWPPT